MKKIISLLLAFSMCLTLAAPAALAVETENDTANTGSVPSEETTEDASDSLDALDEADDTEPEEHSDPVADTPATEDVPAAEDTEEIPEYNGNIDAQPVTPAADSNDELMPLDATASINWDTTDINITNYIETIDIGNSFTTTLSVSENYVFAAAPVVTMSNVNISSTAVTLNANGSYTISIAAVTGIVEISAAARHTNCTVTYSVNNVSSSYSAAYRAATPIYSKSVYKPSTSTQRYTFIGWKSSLDHKTYVTSQLRATAVTEDVTYTALYRVHYNIAAATVSAISARAYTGSFINPPVTVSYGGTTLKLNTDYTVAYYNSVKPGTAAVIITGKGNYYGTYRRAYTIQRRSLSTVTVAAISARAYTGSSITPPVTVSYGKNILKLNTDYTVAYYNCVKPGTAAVIITGKGNYYGTYRRAYTIQRRSLSTVTVAAISARTYTGSSITPPVTVSYGKNTLKLNTDYTVAYYNSVNPGTAAVIITGKGNYYGTYRRAYTIQRRSLSTVAVKAISSQSYTGKYLKPVPVVYYGKYILKADRDYTLSYKNNKKRGTATITITGKGNFTGTKTTTFQIVSPSLSTAQFTASDIDDQFYTGSAITPKPDIYFNGNKLTLNKHYTLSYQNNTKVGTATITVKGKGSYTGSNTITFEIVQQSIKKATLTTIANQKYTGSALKPVPVLTYNGIKLVNKTDYIVSYKNNTAIGTATVTIKGIGQFTGSVITIFKIVNSTTTQNTYLSYQVTASALNYRVGAGTNYAIAGSLQQGTLVKVVKGANKTVGSTVWYQIYLNGKYYYVSSTYLRAV